MKLGRSRLRKAIENARRLYSAYDSSTAYHDRKPATTVHLLVEHLLKLDPTEPEI